MNDQITKRVLQSMTVLILAVFGLGVVFANVPVSRSIFARSNVASSSAGSSYLYRFDPNSQTWFTYTLPIGALPQSVATTGTNPVHVWVAEYGLNKIGHLIYTDTSHTSFVEYPVTSTANSQPFRVTLNGNYVWFTERGANRVGRLDATTGQIDEFYGNGLSANSGLADVQVAPNGVVWLAGQQSNAIISLTVNSPNDYAFRSYTDTLLVGPFDLAIENFDKIWFTAPAVRRIGVLLPSFNQFIWPQIPTSTFSYPAEIVFSGGASWTTDPVLNRVVQLSFDTLTLPEIVGPIARPMGAASSTANQIWMTQQDGHGALGRLVFTTTSQFRFDSFPLPTNGLVPIGIDISADHGVWSVAYIPFKIYLPVTLKNAS